jgi:hypothetical protein
MDSGDTLAFFVQAGAILFAGAGANGGVTRDLNCHRGRVDSGIGISVLVYVDGAFCSLYYPDCFWHITEFGDLEKFSALSTPYSSVGGVLAKQPVVFTSRALGNNLHLAAFLEKGHKNTMYFRQKDRTHP